MKQFWFLLKMALWKQTAEILFGKLSNLGRPVKPHYLIKVWSSFCLTCEILIQFLEQGG